MPHSEHFDVQHQHNPITAVTDMKTSASSESITVSGDEDFDQTGCPNLLQMSALKWCVFEVLPLSYGASCYCQSITTWGQMHSGKQNTFMERSSEIYEGWLLVYVPSLLSMLCLCIPGFWSFICDIS